MLRLISYFLFLTISSIAIAGVELENASIDYKQNVSYKSLSIITNHLSEGMRKSEVEKLLGDADYSPTDGLFYYSSDKREISEISGRKTIIGLVIDYRNSKGEVTEELQNFKLGFIGE